MPRNMERDEREALRRKNQLIEAGFQLFAEHGIENISLQEVAVAAEVGPATLYKYYQNKVNLVIAISGKKWQEFWSQINANGFSPDLTAYQMIASYTDIIIRIYHENPSLLRFSGMYKSYIRREGASAEQLRVQLDGLQPISVLFHNLYERAKEDHSIRTDISEQVMFRTIALTMLCMAERYALGIVWADDQECNGDHTQELTYLKEMLLDWCKRH